MHPPPDGDADRRSLFVAVVVVGYSMVGCCCMWNREIWGAIQYSPEKYPEKCPELMMIFVILFKMFSGLILTRVRGS